METDNDILGFLHEATEGGFTVLEDSRGLTDHLWLRQTVWRSTVAQQQVFTVSRPLCVTTASRTSYNSYSL